MKRERARDRAERNGTKLNRRRWCAPRRVLFCKRPPSPSAAFIAVGAGLEGVGAMRTMYAGGRGAAPCATATLGGAPLFCSQPEGAPRRPTPSCMGAPRAAVVESESGKRTPRANAALQVKFKTISLIQEQYMYYITSAV